MAKIIFLTSILFLSSHLSEQTKLKANKNFERINALQKKAYNYSTTTQATSSSANNITDETTTFATNKLEDDKKVINETLEKQHSILLGNIRFKTSDPKYVSDDKILKVFDARIYWPQCKTIGEVHNKGNSPIDLAFAATGTLADRMCIETKGVKNQLLSAEELISCSGQDYHHKHVHSFETWEYLKSHGVVSGGKYNSDDGCQPFQVPPICELPTYHNRHACIRQCYGNKSIDYISDHVKVKNWYVIKGRRTPVYVQKEVQAYGPVVAYFDLYDDFFLYKSGVYERSKAAKFVKFQHAKLIGWGVENGVEYWLLVHSVGSEWGQNGLFKIKKGTNECCIENWITGIVPEIK